VHPVGSAAPGTIVGQGAVGGPLIATGSGALELRTVQPAGKRPMPGADWFNGLRERTGQLGNAL
jgi:methionyl-tRNA formyltransferase